MSHDTEEEDCDVEAGGRMLVGILVTGSLIFWGAVAGIALLGLL